MITAAWLFGVGGAILIGIGAFFLFKRPALLPEDLRYLQRSAAEVGAAIPRLRGWLRLVFRVLGGYVVAVGTLTVYVAATEVRSGTVLAAGVLSLAGLASIGVMTLVNFALHSAFRWLLSLAAVVWVAAALAAVLH